MALTDQGRQLRSYSLTSGASVSLDNVVIHTDHLNRVTRARRAASGPPLGRSRRRTPSRHLHPSGRCSWVVTDPHDLSSRGRGLRQPGTGMLMSLVVRARAGNGTRRHPPRRWGGAGKPTAPVREVRCHGHRGPGRRPRGHPARRGSAPMGPPASLAGPIGAAAGSPALAPRRHPPVAHRGGSATYGSRTTASYSSTTGTVTTTRPSFSSIGISKPVRSSLAREGTPSTRTLIRMSGTG